MKKSDYIEQCEDGPEVVLPLDQVAEMQEYFSNYAPGTED